LLPLWSANTSCSALLCLPCACGYPHRVAVLEGGLPAWKAAGGPVDDSAVPDDSVHRASKAAKGPVQGTKYKAVLKKDKVSAASASVCLMPVEPDIGCQQIVEHCNTCDL
jgi:hypothetical protein